MLVLRHEAPHDRRGRRGHRRADLVARARDARDYDERDDLTPRFNYKMTDMQAALGRSQLVRLDAFIARRRARGGALPGGARARPRCRVPSEAGERHVYHRFVVAIEAPLAPVLTHLERRGVTARRPVFRPIHRALGLSGYPNAERLWAESLRCRAIPCSPTSEVDTVATALLGGPRVTQPGPGPAETAGGSRRPR